MQMHFIVITASYNRPDLLIRNIKALQCQTHKNWQQIIVDDHSSCDMQLAFDLALMDDRIKVIQLSANRGCNYARNTALNYIYNNNIEGYITLVDDDDYFLPEAMELVEKESSSIVNRKWITADCCYPDGKKASKLSRYGQLSYIDNYMYGNEIKGDLNHFICTSTCKDLKFSEKFRNGQEWSFFCQLSTRTNIEALNHSVKVIEYLEGGLSNKKINAKNRIDVFNHKIEVLKNIVSAKKLSHQKLLLAREHIAVGNIQAARDILIAIYKYHLFSFKFYRYFLKTIV
jgi:glycosyltransferase involved in cell wall biosynthesis